MRSIKSYITFFCIFFLYPALINPGCSSVSLEIVEPADGAKLKALDQIRVTYSGIDNDTLNIVLNGEAITEAFDIGLNEASASGKSVNIVLRQGQNTLEAFAIAGNSSPADRVSFFLDSRPPDIVVTSIRQNNKAETNENATLTITGTIKDVSPITAFAINSVSPSVSGESFTVTVPVAETLAFEAEDAYTNRYERTFLRPGVTVTQGMVVRWMSDTFDLYLPDLLNELLIKPIEPRLIAKNPITEGDYNPLVLPIHYTANVRNELNDDPGVTFIAVDDSPRTLFLEESIENTSVDIEVTLTQGSVITRSNIKVNVDRAFVADTILIATVEQGEKQRPDQISENRFFQVETQTLDIDLNGITVSGDPLPPDIEQIVKNATMEDLEAVLQEIAEETFEGFINDSLSSITFDMDIGESVVVELQGDANTLMTESEGASFQLDTLNHSTTSDPDVKIQPGSRFTRSNPPSMPSKTRSGNLPYGFAISLSDDWVNQYLYMLYRNNAFNYATTTTVEASLEDVLPPEVLEILPGSNLKVSLFTEDSPSMRFDDPDHTAIFQMDKGIMQVLIQNDSNGQFVLLFRASINGTFPTTISIIEGGTAIHFTFDEASEVTFNSVTLGDFSIPLLVIEDIVNALLPLFLPFMSETVGNIPVPSISGYSLNLVELTPDGNDLDFLTIYGFLLEGE